MEPVEFCKYAYKILNKQSRDRSLTIAERKMWSALSDVLKPGKDDIENINHIVS